MFPDAMGVLFGAEKHTMVCADVIEVVSTLPDKSIDFVFTDVPYGLGSHEPTPEEILAYLQGASLDTGGDFMGTDWQIPSIVFWKEVYRVAKPGCLVFCYAGPKTMDLISMGIRMAGFISRNCLQWLYAQGNPKGIGSIGRAIDKADGNEREVIGTRTLSGTAALKGGCQGITHGALGKVSDGAKKEVPITAPATEESEYWEGHATGLAPSWEPILVFMKPIEGTYVENIREYGLGSYNIDGCRIATDWNEPDRPDSWKRSGHTSKPDADKLAAPPGNGIACNTKGRWPTNVVVSQPVDSILDQQGGIRTSGSRKAGVRKGFGYGSGAKGDGGPAIEASSGTISRYYPCFPNESIDPVMEEFQCQREEIPGSVNGAEKSFNQAPQKGDFVQTVAPCSSRQGSEDRSELSSTCANCAENTLRNITEITGCTVPKSVKLIPTEQKGRSANCAENLSDSCETGGVQSVATCYVDQEKGSSRGEDSTQELMSQTQSRCRAVFAENQGNIGTIRTTASQNLSSGIAQSTTSGYTISGQKEAREQDLITFQFCPKSSRTEREMGCELLPAITRTELNGRAEESAGQHHPSAGIRREGEIRNHGKCIKPINLGRWLARLGGKPGGVALVPYAGTGSEVIACVLEGMRVVGIELDPTMIPVANARIDWWQSHPGGLTVPAKQESKRRAAGQAELTFE
jgi:DNA modification methylase